MVSRPTVVQPDERRDKTPLTGAGERNSTPYLTHNDRKCTVLYRDLLTLVQMRSREIASVSMSPRKVYRCTKPLLYCASKVLSVLAYRLSGLVHPELGVKLSYRELAEELLGEYCEEFVAVAARLLVMLGLVESPEQDSTTRRAFTWKMHRQTVQQALDKLSSATTDISASSQHRASYLVHADRKCTVLYRDLLTLVQVQSREIASVSMSPRKVYRCTKPLLYCASKVLSVLAYRLSGLVHPELGVKLSYRELAEELLGEYCEEFVAVAARLLVMLGLIESPEQDSTTRRAFTWKMHRQTVQHILTTLNKSATPSDFARQATTSKGSEIHNEHTVKKLEEHDHAVPTSTQDISSVEKGEIDASKGIYPPCESELVEQPIELPYDSDSSRPPIFRFFSSTLWSSAIVRDIIAAMNLLPEKQWERQIVEKQCDIVHAQMLHLPPTEACRRLIISLEYMKTHQPFWKNRFCQGKSIVLSLGSNHDGSHHHCLEMYEELTRKGTWHSSLLADWHLSQMAQDEEQAKCMRLAVKSYGLEDQNGQQRSYEDLVTLGRPLYEQQQRQRCLEGREDPREASQNISDNDISTVQERSALLKKQRKALCEDEGIALVNTIADALPYVGQHLYFEDMPEGGVTVCVQPPGLAWVRLTSMADWDLLYSTLQHMNGNWNAALDQLLGPGMIDESDVEEMHSTDVQGASEPGMTRDEACDLAELIVREKPMLAPYIFRGAEVSEGRVTVCVQPPGLAWVRLTSMADWDLLYSTLQHMNGNWNAALDQLQDLLLPVEGVVQDD